MVSAIKVSHHELTAVEKKEEFDKWIKHPAYSLFLNLLAANTQNVTTFNHFALYVNVGLQASNFPSWLCDNILLLGDKGLNICIQLENGVILSNTPDITKNGKNPNYKGSALGHNKI